MGIEETDTKERKMRRSFKLQNLGCANCAAKMEDAISKLDGVNKASISFMTQRLLVDANDDDFDRILDQAQKICSRIEKDCSIVR